MNIFELLGFAGAMFLLAASPGPGVAATVGRALSAGFARTLPMIAGIICGDLVFLVLAARGLAIMAEHLHSLFFVVRCLGGAWLIWLGVQSLLQAFRKEPSVMAAPTGQRRVAGFLGGLALTLGNPKVIIFYMGFLPTFMDMSGLTNLDLGLAAMVVAAVLGLVLAAYAWGADRSRRLLSSPRRMAGARIASGLVLTGAGAAVLSRS